MKVITIAGNLGKSAEVQSNQKGEFITFSVAVTEGSKENKKTIWFGCSSYKTNLAQYLLKGTKVVVTGTLIIEEKGNRTFHNVRASHIQFWNDRKVTTQDQSEDTPESSENSGNTNQDFDDEIPF
jgi:single-stranded DNA-binding protein